MYAQLLVFLALLVALLATVSEAWGLWGGLGLMNPWLFSPWAFGGFGLWGLGLWGR